MRHRGHVITYCTSTSSTLLYLAMETPKSETAKRPRGTPTFLTPITPKKRVPLKEIANPGTVQPKRLEFQTTDVAPLDNPDVPEHDCRGLGWSNAELRALVEFILLHGTGESWPTHHRMCVWEAAAAFIKSRAATTTARSGTFIIILSYLYYEHLYY